MTRGWRAGDPYTDTPSGFDPHPDPADTPDPWAGPLTPAQAANDTELVRAARAGDVAAGWEAAWRGIPWKDAA